MEVSQLRKFEKEKMSYDRDLRSAIAAGSKRGRGQGRLVGEEPASKRGAFTGSARGGRGRGRGGAQLTCFRCGDPSHLVASCRKDFAK